MNICPKCGSGSRDRDGFCGGCGARRPLREVRSLSSRQSSGFAKWRADINSIGLEQARPKRMWVGVALATVLGPVGLAYSTMWGTAVMVIVGIGLRIWLIVLPICGLWAWWALRDYGSVLD